MPRLSPLRLLHAAEKAVDGLIIDYKWRFDRWKHLQVRPFRGFGTRDGKLHLRGRVLDDKGIRKPDPEQPTWKNALNTLRRIDTDEIPGARVRLRFREQTLEAETDEEGFFVFDFEAEKPLRKDRVWHEVALELLAPTPERLGAADATGRLIVPREEAEFAVVSDLDDTVVRTGATDRLQMSRVVLLNNAQTRAPFPGVSALYRALQRGPDAEGHNPVFYVSSSPWNLYSMFQGFFEHRDLPTGPIFLKDYGVTANRLFKSGHGQHKAGHITRLIETYPDLPFVLIGDSGQHDPEIYRRLVGEHGERIRAVLIRDVTPKARDDEVQAIARQVRRMGVPMHLVEQSDEAAERAAEHDLITGEAVEDVRKAMQREMQETDEPSGLRERLFG